MYLKYQATGYSVKEDGHKCALKFGNALVFHPDTYHRSVIPHPWNEALRVSLSLVYMKRQAHL